MASLAATFGRGAMTNGWTDIRNADVVLAMGGNPAENHPVGFRFVMEAQAQSQREAGLRRSALQPHRGGGRRFVQIRVGTDIAFLGGLIHYALSRNRFHEEYVRAFTNAHVPAQGHLRVRRREGRVLGLERGDQGVHRHLELGLRARRARLCADRSVDAASAVGVPGDEGVLRALHAGGGGQHLRLHAPRTSSRPPSSSPRPTRADRAGTIMYALGWTHHSHSVQLIHAAAMLQLLLGNIGRPGGGVNALRGHANIQGGTDCGVAYHNLPGYIPIPKADHESLEAFVTAVTPKPLRANVTNFWSNTDRFIVSQLKAYYGTHATRDNGFGYALHPRLPQDEARRLRELELGLHLRPHVPRAAWRGSSASA